MIYDMTPDDCDLASEGAALGLLAIMRGLSEEHWAAGWMIGLEYACWSAVQKGGIPFGMGAISERQAKLMELLANEAGGWWESSDEKERPVLVPLGVWREKAAKVARMV